MQPATDIFPVRFRQARAIARRSLRELASDLHVSHTLLNRYETGAAKPVASMLLKIADALGVAPDFFFRREQPALQEIRFRKKSALGAREKRSIEERAKDFFSRYLEIEQIAAFLAMLAAQPGVGLLNWVPLVGQVSDELSTGNENYRFALAGLTVENEVAYSGYRPVGGFLLPEEGTEQSYAQFFSIRVE